MTSRKQHGMEDQTALIVRENLGRIRLIAVASTLLLDPLSRDRVLRVIDKFGRWGLPKPVIGLLVHNDDERIAAEEFAIEVAEKGKVRIVPEKGHNKMYGTALQIYAEEVDARAERFTAKRRTLLLARRGGGGQPQFIEPFTHGEGTTCGEWTRVVEKRSNGTKLRGFMSGCLASGYCPVACKFCFLQMAHTDGMVVYGNWEDLGAELARDWADYQYPINFGDKGGLVEYDEWLAEPDGEGSMVQYLINACCSANVSPALLTKIRYGRHLKFRGRVQVGISLMPEEIRCYLAPHGSPSDELLESLAWAVGEGAVDPTIRMFTMWERADLYPQLLESCRDLLGARGWRLTVDLPRFTPRTLVTIGKRYGTLAEEFHRELDPEGSSSLRELAREGQAEKKLRPPVERQFAIYRGIREMLDALGCDEVPVSACKANPEEILPLVREGTLAVMPCACYANGPGGAVPCTGVRCPSAGTSSLPVLAAAEIGT